MGSLFRKPVVVILFAVLVVGIGLLAFFSWHKKPEPAPIPQPLVLGPKHEVIGTSVHGRKIEAYTYGNGPKHLLFVGGIHGGYEWNSVLLSYQFMDYLGKDPAVIPDDLSVTVIPSANPDGVFEVTGKEGRFVAADVTTNKEVLASARFNSHDVDLNRNFDCNWKPEGTWQSKKVSAGTSVFSEPETVAIRDFVLGNKPAAVVFWHSQANTVYPGECGAGIMSETTNIMNAYAHAAGYQTATTFDSYEVNGASDGWLANIGIPTLTVELKTHETVEWEQNLAGVKALFEYYK